MLNSDNEKRASEQAVWLEKILQATRSKQVFLIYHHPSYRISSFHGWHERKEFQLAVRPVIWKYQSKITAIMVGHDHLAGLFHFDNLPVILSGAVQEVRLDSMVNHVDTSDRNHPVQVQSAWYFDHEAYWAQLSIPEEKEGADAVASVHFTRAKDSYVSCSAKLITGKKAELAPNCFTKPPRLPQ